MGPCSGPAGSWGTGRAPLLGSSHLALPALSPFFWTEGSREGHGGACLLGLESEGLGPSGRSSCLQDGVFPSASSQLWTGSRLVGSAGDLAAAWPCEEACVDGPKVPRSWVHRDPSVPQRALHPSSRAVLLQGPAGRAGRSRGGGGGRSLGYGARHRTQVVREERCRTTAGGFG